MSIAVKSPDPRMTRVVEAVRKLNRAASLCDISQALAPEGEIPRRTLQRWLATLVREKRLLRKGLTKNARYIMGKGETTPAAPVTMDIAPVAASLQDRLSAASRAIQTAVRQPASRRHPVGYNGKFLDDYRPNVTAYVPGALREKLLKMGRVDGEHQPAGTYLRKVMDRLLIDLSWNSSRLEGNTYSLLETQRLLEFGERAVGKEARDAQMILNHKAAIELLSEQAAEIGFNRYTICNLHALLAENLLTNPSAGGRLREHPVGITHTVFHPLEVPPAIAERFDQVLDTAAAITDAFEQALFAMVQLPYLQPFEDVNKRVSRLAANIPLIRHNLGPLSFIDVPTEAYTEAMLGVYELNRVDYIRDVFEWAYERSCARYAALRQSLGEPDIFRMRHREQLGQVVRAVVTGTLGKTAAAALVKQEAARLGAPEEAKAFADLAEAELDGMHEGNFARYRIRPSEFAAWRAVWR